MLTPGDSQVPNSTKIRLANRSTQVLAPVLNHIRDDHFSLSAQAAHETLRTIHETLLQVINPEVVVTYELLSVADGSWREIVTVREPTHSHPYVVLLHETMAQDPVRPRDPQKRFGRVYNQLAHYLGDARYCHPTYVESLQRLFPELLVNMQQTHQYYVEDLGPERGEGQISFRAKAYDGTSLLSILSRSHQDVVAAENECMRQAMTMGYRIPHPSHITH